MSILSLADLYVCVCQYLCAFRSFFCLFFLQRKYLQLFPVSLHLQKRSSASKRLMFLFLIGRSLSCFIHFHFHKTVECYGEHLRFLNLRMFFFPKDFLKFTALNKAADGHTKMRSDQILNQWCIFCIWFSIQFCCVQSVSWAFDGVVVWTISGKC